MLVRLLFDENLSPALVRELADVFPESTHVRELRLQSAPYDAIWGRAAVDGFIVVTKDDDFRQQRQIVEISASSRSPDELARPHHNRR